MDLKDLNRLVEQRRAISPLLSPEDPAEALTAYYALWHDPRRTQITLHHAASQTEGASLPQPAVDGFITVSQTGVDLFRPLVTAHPPSTAALGELLHAALTRHRSYRFVVTADLAAGLGEYVHFGRYGWSRLYELKAPLFRPVVNVLVQSVSAADGAPHFQIESQGQLVAMSGTNWRSPTFAEVFVYVHPRGRGRGWGQSVVSACTTALIQEGLRPLYMVEEGNEASIRIAVRLGYTDTGVREFSAEGELA